MILRWLFIVCLVAGAAPACSRDNPAAPREDTAHDESVPVGFTISDVVPGGVSDSRFVAARSGASAYVSAVPHTFAEAAEAVSIRNITTLGRPLNLPLTMGGFDPVRIEGDEGDEISISIYGHADKLSELKVKIPPRRPPRIVRTYPDKGRIDVALNVVIEVVFTEPIDPASVDNSSVTVLRDGAAISGTLRVRNSSLTAEFLPDSPLEPGTEYTLSVSQQVRDLDHEPLAEPAVLSFRTIDAVSSLKTLIVSTSTTSVSGGPVDPDGYLIQLDSRPPVHIDTDGSQLFTGVVQGVHTLRISGLSANCETDGATRLIGIPTGTPTVSHYDVICKPQAVLEGMLAFVSDRDGNPEIYTSNVDGTGLRRLTNNAVADLSPAWSPDGNRIAFSRDDGIYIMNADGSNVVRLSNGLSDVEPAWSPDGSQIAYAGRGGIYVRSVSQPSGGPEQFGYTFSWNSHPSWSPDGQFILFGSDYGTGDSWHLLWRVRTDDLHASPRYLNLGDVSRTVYMLPTWSPDASQFAFATCDWFYLCYGPGSLSIASADGSGIRHLADINNIDGITWSPDGSIIAYSSRGCPECTAPSIYHITTDGSMRGLVISDAYMPAWRPVH